MTIIEQLPDATARQQALNITQSCIVQAPAGSGKTELLIQRYLALLGNAVNHPEEVIAITFTRKAAGEMRERILTALHKIYNGEVLNNSVTQQLTKKVLEKDISQHWNLLNNPNRLRIQTIDSLCASLTRQLPITSELGGSITIIENPTPLYHHAAQQLLQTLEQPVEWQSALKTLLLHLDNALPKVEQLLVDMLGYREQWLPYLFSTKQYTNPRFILESALQASITNKLKQLTETFPKQYVHDLLTIITYAASQIEVNHPLRCCAQLTEFPNAHYKNLSIWRAIAEFLLTMQGTWRKCLDKRQGLPAIKEAKPFKEAALALIENLQQVNNLQLYFANVLTLPDGYYNNNQWQVLDALITLLPILSGYLQLSFRKHKQVDFTEIALKANHALGDTDSPTDLALALDYKIQHILIDEFQDTSQLQFDLLTKLVAGWQAGDGRTLFLVGDPMQSIYRFRKAEVSLFLRAQHHGIGGIALQSLFLTSNFRSTPTIVNWINNTFANLFPKNADLSTSAVPFHQCDAMLTQNQPSNITFHPIIDSHTNSEDKIVLELITAAKKFNSQQSIAILVRSRAHLNAIIPTLKAANIAFRATEIERLTEKTIIQDLAALTLALNHLGHRTAWLAILRAPWCGLTLQDLETLANSDNNITLWQRVQEYSTLDLSAHGKQQLQRIVPIIQAAFKQRQRVNLAHWIEGIWINLGGICCIQSDEELKIAKEFFNFLINFSQQANFSTIHLIDELQKLFLNTTPIFDNNPIEIMTIHKAKGLEFDTVILPSLDKRSQTDDSQLLLLQDEITEYKNYFLMAPIKAASDTEDKIYNYLANQEKCKAQQELIRLLYVATTRAKTNLHVLGKFTVDAEGNIKKPSGNTFLNLLEKQFLPFITDASTTTTNAQTSKDSLPLLKRLRSDWQMPTLENFYIEKPISLNDAKIIDETDNSLYTSAQATGIVIHRILKAIATDGIAAWQIKNLNQLKPFWQQALIQLGISKQEAELQIPIIKSAIEKTLADPKGCWILDTNHQNSVCEWPLTGYLNNQLTRIIIDRSFIDENGIRWIIDYKSSINSEGNLTDFLLSEHLRYQSQLENYAKILSTLEKRTTRLGLYFPLLSAWHEWTIHEE